MKEQIKKENLKQRAYLNAITSILDFIAKNITGFFVTPFLVSGLGSTLYGAWQVLGQLTGYTNWADFRAAEVLKWSVARERDAGNDIELRRNVTTTFVILLFVLPLILIVGTVLSWYAPIIIGIDAEYYNVIRITSLLLVLSLIIDKVFNVFEAILRGMNLGFKRMGIRALIVIVGGGLKILAILLGYGLIGLAIIQIFVSFLVGITIYWILKKNVKWYGLGNFELSRSKSFLKTSGWFMAWTITKMLLLSSDKILLTYLTGPIMVAKYALTKFLAETIRSLVITIVNAVIPGMGKLYGAGEMEKFVEARRIVMTLTWLFAITIGVVILVINSSFLALWVGEDKFAGEIVSLLVILMTIQYIFIQNDSDIINVTLDIKKKTKLGLLSAVFSIGLGFLLVPGFGIAGLCLSIIVGRSILSFTYPLILSAKTGLKGEFRTLSFRQLIISLLVFAAAFFIEKVLTLDNWSILILISPVIMAICLALLYFAGLNKSQRKELYILFKQIKVFKTER